MNGDTDQIAFHTEAARPSAAVIPFPMARRRKKVLGTARTLDARKTKGGKEAFWNRTTREISNKLRGLGASDEQVRRELWAFRAAVGAEMRSDRERERM